MRDFTRTGTAVSAAEVPKVPPRSMAEILCLDARQTELFTAAEPRLEPVNNPGKKLTDEMDSRGLLITSHPAAPFRKRAAGGVYPGLLPELRKRRVFCATGIVEWENGMPILIVERLSRP